MDAGYTFKKIDKREVYYIGCFIDNKKYYVYRHAGELVLDLKKRSEWIVSPITENGIIDVAKWRPEVIDVIVKNNPEKIFIGDENEIIQMLIPNPHKLKLGVKEWMIDIPSKK